MISDINNKISIIYDSILKGIKKEDVSQGELNPESFFVQLSGFSSRMHPL